MHKVSKGHFGYLKYKKKVQFLKSFLVLLSILLLLGVGLWETKSIKNWFTIVAVVTALPFANFLVVWLALLPHHGRSREEYEQVAALAGDGLLNCELVVTSREKAMPLPYAIVHASGIYAYTDQKNADLNKISEYIKTMEKSNGYEVHVKVFGNFNQFLKRLKELLAESRDEVPEDQLKVEGVLRAISM